ncbi:Transmembrane and coiled-coil domains protein 2 [Larimichthys crocea]|uniref:Uncharacterized protein n=1 Tax=Larimichthys crocea TaxID=215358 RepID=A0ACD3RJL4_LARCR|nr:Transmembrane and coiled-coil domains protein 2 [Larimichthys crocea]
MFGLGQEKDQRVTEAAVTPKRRRVEPPPRREKENIPCSPERCELDLEKTPEKGENTGLKRKQTNITGVWCFLEGTFERRRLTVNLSESVDFYSFGSRGMPKCLRLTSPTVHSTVLKLYICHLHPHHSPASLPKKAPRAFSFHHRIITLCAFFTNGTLDKSEVATLGLPSTTSHGGSDSNISADGAAAAASGVMAGGAECSGAGEPQRTRAALEHLQQKILKVTEQIRVEQEARDDNVAEYLKLAHNADKQQASRIKQVFEKKNQKSAQTIAHLHKKLEHYHKKLKEIEQNGPARQPKDVLRDMQQGLKDVGANVRAGISGFGGGVVEGVKGGVSALTHTAVVSKPREFASLIRNKFGSADNIAHLKDTLEDGVGGHSEDAPTPRALSGSATLVSSPKYGSDDECSSATSGSGAGSNSGGAGGGGGGGGGGGLLGPTMGSPRLDGHHHHHHHMHSSWDSLLEGLQEIKASQAHMEDAIEDMKGQLQSDYSYMTQCLQEERYRYERLEEQLNDLTELHQNEMTNLKQELASMEEKVAYQSYERARDIQEAVESCLTRITKLELQQQQQQVVQLEGVENANARALLGKLINVILALMAVLLVFVSTLANFITPLMKTRARVAATVLLTLLLFVLWKQWDFVEPWLLPS